MTDLSALTASPETPPNAAQARLVADTQSFLKLLTTQLSNQDPLAPVDPTQFVSQLAQFSSVEQAVQSNMKLADVLSQLRASGDRMDLAYLGREVEVATDQIVAGPSGVGAARYSIPEGAERVSVRILDGEGRVVRTLPAGTTPGVKDLDWNGTRDDGTPAAAGVYRLEVKAFDRNDKALDTRVTVTDAVARVARSDGETLFVLKGGQQVTRDQIVSAG